MWDRRKSRDVNRRQKSEKSAKKTAFPTLFPHEWIAIDYGSSETFIRMSLVKEQTARRKVGKTSIEWSGGGEGEIIVTNIN